MPILAVAVLLLMQATPRDLPRPSGQAAGQIVGVLLSDAQQPTPIRHARVTCTSLDVHGGQTTSTDDTGHFAFMDLAPARYTVSASKTGWVNASYGATFPGRPGTPVPVSKGQRVELTIRMTHGAVITGTVTDQNGRPAVGTSVRAMQYSFMGGERGLSFAGAFANAGSDGTYRIYGLAPGDYVINATALGPGLGGGEVRVTTDLDVQHAMDDPPGTPAPVQKTVDVSPTFFPGTVDATEASVVSVHAGEERSGIDFALQLVSTASIDGSVAMPDGTTPPATQVMLLAASGSGFPGIGFGGFKQARPGPNGKFSIGSITPGQYTLVARSTPRPSPMGTPAAAYWASMDLSIQGDRLSGLSLVLQPAMVLSGRVQFDGTTLPPPDPKTIQIGLRAASQGWTVAPPPGRVNPDGTFSLTGLTPGQYHVLATIPGSPDAPSWQVRSAEFNGHDVLDAPLTVEPNQNVTDVVVTFTDHPARLTGTLETGSGAPAADYSIVLFAQEPASWHPQSRYIQETRPAADGTYTFRNVAPGNYLLAAVGDVEPGQWFNPSFLETLVPGAMKIAIADGEQKVQDVKLGGS